MLKVAVLDTKKNILAPCHPARAKELLDKGKAAVYRRYPFTIILKREIPKSEIKLPSLRIKIDPGSRITGLAILDNSEVIWCAELTHRGLQVKSDLDSRRGVRRGRRHRKTRYRKPRFDNRTRPKGWLPPSLMSRVYLDNVRFQIEVRQHKHSD